MNAIVVLKFGDSPVLNLIRPSEMLLPPDSVDMPFDSVRNVPVPQLSQRDFFGNLD
jgi:hypothetical protein